MGEAEGLLLIAVSVWIIPQIAGFLCLIFGKIRDAVLFVCLGTRF